MAFNFNIFSAGGGSSGTNGFAKYPNAGSLPAGANDGDIAITLNNYNLYAFESGSNTWVIIGGPGIAITDGNTDSIGMSFMTNTLTAFLRFPPGITGLPANYSGVTLQSYSGSSPGLVALVAGFRVGEVTSSVLQFVGNSFPVLGTSFGIQVNQATGSTPGYLSAADWTAFNGKVGISSIIQTFFPLMGGTNLPSSGGITLSIPVGTGSTGGYISSTDWTTFNNKLGTGATIAQLGNIAANSILGNNSGSPAAITALTIAQLKAMEGTSLVNSGDVTLGAFLAATSTVGATISAAQVLSFTEAQTTNPGLVSANAQTWNGAKTFASDIIANTFIRFMGASQVSIGSTSTAGQTLLWAGGVGGTYSNLLNDGRGFMSWSYAVPGFYRTVTNAGATLLIQDRFIEITTGVTNQTLNCSWSNGNTGVYFSVQKIDSGVGNVTIQDPNLINGVTNFIFQNQWECHQFVSNGIGLRVIS